MKSTLSKLALLSSSILLATSAMADVTASATARWDATATKDTTSSLVVTPLRSLSFQYAEGENAFNQQTGAFDVTIQGQSGATDFELSSKLVGNTLSRTGDTSTLQVGVAWNGSKLSPTEPVFLINTADDDFANAGLEALAQSTAYAGADRSSARGSFIFTVDNATSDGSTDAAFADLADGTWDGEVAVQFTAHWTTP
ncbi:fimbrial protein [Acinetobacter sp. ANC 4558]|uniref:common pilus major fimbrillin subunit EcpA n=1 Tax=Acinetobacter sp. ANC 4558 TaxID=1977876 RepID=UPI000A33B10F|nr:common pilus major fimbrillin subunit EcpA [Acinetobacter sp. ANC 4558]OTG85317.1 fimbrial protein [Acinetobacter sp. ANC 4558]